MSSIPQLSDCLVVGAGIAGISAALAVADQGKRVDLLIKSSDETESNSWHAQGGIVGNGFNDSPESLAEDIMEAGDHMNWSRAVNLIASEGPSLVDRLLVDRAGVEFNRKDGEMDLTREGAHKTRRIYHHNDQSGKAIMKGLMKLAEEHPLIHIHYHMMAVDIITNCHHSTLTEERYRPLRAVGLYVYNTEEDRVHAFFASSVVLATGGIGDIYKHSSNPSSATGDGIAMAYRAGASMVNGEYVQFHPTTLYHRDVRNFLITESLRGEGAHLINRDGERFMKRYSPDLMELAPRDEVSRAIYQEMDVSGSSCVFLDARHIQNIDLKERFPGIFNTCLKLGIDIQKDLIPVVPAAHYYCGGVKVNLEGETSIRGLYAVGETACTGVHGANRLASVSLLEGLYFGTRAGKSLAEKAPVPSKVLIDSIPEWKYPKEQMDIDPMLIHSDRQTIQSLMWNYTGIIRTRKRLKRAMSDLNYLSHRVESFYREARISRQLLELRNSLLTAYLVTRAASSNPSSKGCHYLED